MPIISYEKSLDILVRLTKRLQKPLKSGEKEIYNRIEEMVIIIETNNAFRIHIIHGLGNENKDSEAL